MKRVIFLVLVLTIRVFGYINIYPTEFDKDITKGVSGSFRLYNRLNKPVKYRIYLEKNKVKNDMSDWIEIYPTAILLNPLEKKEIKYLITPSKTAKSGEYSAVLVIKELNLPKAKKDKRVNFLTLLKLNMKGRIKSQNDI